MDSTEHLIGAILFAWLHVICTPLLFLGPLHPGTPGHPLNPMRWLHLLAELSYPPKPFIDHHQNRLLETEGLPRSDLSLCHDGGLQRSEISEGS